MPYIITFFVKESEEKFIIGVCKTFSSTDALKYDLYKISPTFYQLKSLYIIDTLFIDDQTYQKLQEYLHNNAQPADNFLNKINFESDHYDPVIFDEKIKEICINAISLKRIYEVAFP